MRNKTLLLVLSLLLLGAETHGSNRRGPWKADNGDGTFTNPILWGDWPDPDVIRVGEDFYMVTTSMHYVPGCPILKSKDLVNWEMAGYAVDRYDEDPRYDMEGGQLYLNGSWASCIRHHDGKFYVFFCTPYGWGRDTGHFSVCEAERPEGPWTRTIFPEYMYDPGVLIDDDGRIYVVHGQHHLYVTELEADMKSVKGEPTLIWDKTVSDLSGTRTGGMEGSHVYKKDGMYYVTCPAGGTEGWQMCLRSDNIFGPYESKVIMDDSISYPPNGLHQGGMVELENGDWWFVIMQDRGPIGRSVNLVPVSWEDGWPMLGAGGKDVVTYRKPDVGNVYPAKTPATSDEFNSSVPGLQWQWNHNPDNASWSMSERKGHLRLKAGKATTLKDARNTLTQRVAGPESEATVELDISGLKDGNIAGFGIFEFPYAFVGVRQEDGRREVVMVNDGETIETGGRFQGKKIWLRAHATDDGFAASFSYSRDGRKFIPIGNTLEMGLGLPWTANRFALFNYSLTDEGKGGVADFNWFRLR